MNKKKTTGIVLSVIGVLALISITAGVTIAFFSYAKEGTTENTITTGTITFLYDEKEAAGNGIKITEALPMSDTDGKALAGDNNVFNFTVTANTTSKTAIPYEVTARMKADSDKDLQDKVKLYLTTVNGGAETAAPLTVNGDVVKTFANLTQTSKVALTEAEYNALTSEEEKAKYVASEQLYLYNARSFTVTVNVYANATVVNAGL